MKQTDLAWFQLKFPHDLSQDAVLAALSAFSGVSYNTRLIFDLLATKHGIEHRLAVSPTAAETLLGSLRAAIPSLRLDQIEPPTSRHGRPALWHR